MRWYVQPEADGTFSAVRQNADGSYTMLRSHVSQGEAEAAAHADEQAHSGGGGPRPPGPPGQPSGGPPGYDLPSNHGYGTQLDYGYWYDPTANGGLGGLVPKGAGGGIVGGDVYEQYRKAVASGNYATANVLAQQLAGGKTVTQMRDELAAHDPKWAGASDNEVTSEYLRLAGATGQQPGFDWESYYRSLADTNQKYFDWERANAERNRYASLGQTLIGAASQLRGPENYLQYAQYTSGGRNLMDKLYGSNPVAAFGLPSGFSQPMDLQKLLQDLGLA